MWRSAVLLLLGLGYALSGCQTGYRIDGSYFLQGQAPSDFSGPQAADAAVTSMAASWFTGAVYDFGFYYSRDRHDDYTIRSGDVDFRFGTPSGGVGWGELTVNSGRMDFDFSLNSPDASFSDLRLVGSCDLMEAQRAIVEVRNLHSRPDTSITTTVADWTLSGLRSGAAFNVSFKQTLQGKSTEY